MEEGKNELKVSPFETIKKVMFLAKNMMLKEEKLTLIASTSSVGTAAGAAETLKRLGYITYEDVQTKTVVEGNIRKSRMYIVLKKTAQFDTLYKEHEEVVKKLEAERKQRAEQKAEKKEEK